LSKAFGHELAELQSEFRQLFGMPSDGSAALVLRLAFAEPASVRSRRSLDRVGVL